MLFHPVQIFFLSFLLTIFSLFASVKLNDDDDSFFFPSQNIENYSLGQIIQTRTINVNKTALPSLKSIETTYQIIYRSQGFDETQPQSNVLTLFVPKTFNSSLPIELVLVSAAYDSDNPQCGPSRSILNGKNVPELLTIGMHSKQGRLYAFADYEGPKAAFSQGNVAAAGNLDALRAILNFQKVVPQSKKDSLKAVFEGYSGGGIGVGWTLQRLPSYAPELKDKIIGAAMGGVPSNATKVALYQDGTLGAGFVIAGLFGQAKVDRRIQSWINLRGIPNQIQVAKRYVDTLCVENILLPFVFQEIAETYFNLSTEDVMKDLSLPYREMTLAVQSVQSYPVEPITIPILLIQAIDDQFIPVEANDQYYERLCKNDVKNLSVTYIRNSAGKHIQTAILSAPYAALFLQDRFDKLEPFEGCQMMNQSLTLDDPRFLPAFGEDGMNALKEALENAASLE